MPNGATSLRQDRCVTNIWLASEGANRFSSSFLPHFVRARGSWSDKGAKFRGYEIDGVGITIRCSEQPFGFQYRKQVQSPRFPDDTSFP